MKVQLKVREFGDLVGQSYSLAAAHFPKLFAIVAIFSLPSWAVQMWVLLSNENGATAEQAIESAAAEVILLLLLAAILTPIEVGACTLLVASSFMEDNPTVGDCLRLAFRRIGSLLALSFATGFIMLLGFIPLIIPGFIFLTWYFVATPALMIESIGFQAAMARSKMLTEGNRWNAFAFFLLTTILTTVFVIVDSRGALAAVITNPYLSLALAYVVSSAFATVGVVAPVVFYFNLRVKKEAFDVETLSSLVDVIAQRGAAAP